MKWMQFHLAALSRASNNQTFANHMHLTVFLRRTNCESHVPSRIWPERMKQNDSEEKKKGGNGEEEASTGKPLFRTRFFHGHSNVVPCSRHLDCWKSETFVLNARWKMWPRSRENGPWKEEIVLRDSEFYLKMKMNINKLNNGKLKGVMLHR